MKPEYIHTECAVEMLAQKKEIKNDDWRCRCGNETNTHKQRNRVKINTWRPFTTIIVPIVRCTLYISLCNKDIKINLMASFAYNLINFNGEISVYSENA